MTYSSSKVPAELWSRVLRIVDEGNVLVVTGAGMSAESGIPTFRGADGYWTADSKNYTPQELATNTMLQARPELVWEWYLARLKTYMDAAEPNPGHFALAELETYMHRRAPGRFLLVTQNVDRLHVAAGNDQETVIEIHGSGSLMRCIDECWVRNNQGVPKLTVIPLNASFPEDLTCPDCGSLTRPHVLFFDETYDELLYRSTTAHEFAQEANFVLTVGCSGGVPVAQMLANYAVMRDAVVIDVNPEPSPLPTWRISRGSGSRGRQESCSRG